MDLSLVFAGTAGSVPTARRGLPALLLRAGGDRILFDCGEGTQRQLIRSVGLVDLDAIFLTHHHADHWLGLPGMLKSFDLRDREREQKTSRIKMRLRMGKTTGHRGPARQLQIRLWLPPQTQRRVQPLRRFPRRARPRLRCRGSSESW